MKTWVSKTTQGPAGLPDYTPRLLVCVLRETETTSATATTITATTMEDEVHAHPLAKTRCSIGAIAQPLIAEIFKVNIAAIDTKLQLAQPTPTSPGELVLHCTEFEECFTKAVGKVEILTKALRERQSELHGVDDISNREKSIIFQINITVLSSVLERIVTGEFLSRKPPTKERIMVEFSQPNTHKVFHVGHMRNVALGDFLARLLDLVGNTVLTANYYGDEGAHVAKCLWYIISHRGASVAEQDDAVQSPDANKLEWLGQQYTKACEMLDLASFTTLPFPNTRCAKVTHIGDDKSTVTLYDGSKTWKREFRGSVEKGVRIGDFVAFKDSDFLDNAARLQILPSDLHVPLGADVVEHGRRPEVSASIKSIKEELTKRQIEVADVLHHLENPVHAPAKLKMWLESTTRWSLLEFNAIYKWLDVWFDHEFYESQVSDTSQKLVDELFKDKKLVVESNGALGVDLSEHKLGFCVLRRKDGTGLYATKDLALARIKFEDCKIDRSIYVVDATQSYHFRQVFKILELMGYQQATKCFHQAYGTVLTERGQKMSSRLGNIIPFSELKERLYHNIEHELIDEDDVDDEEPWTTEEREETKRRIAVAAIRYGMLNTDAAKDIRCQLDTWSSVRGNTGPYIQYTICRINKIRRDIQAPSDAVVEFQHLDDFRERHILIMLCNFWAVIDKAVQKFSSSALCAYLFGLAQQFNSWYQQHTKRIRNSAPNVQTTRLLFIQAIADVLGKGLSVLGIETVNRM